jgi:Na+-transporting NADH:ubiquinone oxidoreductase subunit NqrC
MDVETDTNKLCNFVCGVNYFKEGEDPPILPDSEYPDWLPSFIWLRGFRGED